ncbi:MAG: DUF374 domain-containing protein [Parachlamydiaceae bacterium]|nr:DUF374 domain-containing protein [Parachlamydiaceae bacterium]
MIKRFWRQIKPYFLIPAVYLIKGMLRLLVKSCRVEIEGLDAFARFAEADKCILMLWHNRLVIMPEFLHQHASQFLYRAVISKSRDGEMLAILANSYEIGRTLRVAHNARHQALGQMIAQLKSSREVLVVTPDGPRGPRYQIKPGVAVASCASGAKIVPLTWSASRFWQLKSWDRLIIPKPFARIKVIFGEPVALTGKPEENLSDLQQLLLDLDLKACEAVTANRDLWPK